MSIYFDNKTKKIILDKITLKNVLFLLKSNKIGY